MFKPKRSKGFAAMEIIMLLIAVGVATSIVAGLMTFVAKSSKRSAEVGTLLEIRNQINSLNKEPEAWLGKLRGKYSVYAGCIPDAQTPRYISGSFDCPDLEDLTTVDSVLAEKIGTGLYASYTPLVNAQGEVLAGTAAEPVYLNQNGKHCDEPNALNTCPFKSTGFFIRSVEEKNINPGSVRFVVKIERNLGAIAKHSSIFKPEYYTVEVGTAWRNATHEATPVGSIKIGYLVDGTPNYINPAHQCATGQVYVGANVAGAPICKNYPTTCGAQKSAALVSINSELVCASGGSCKDGEVFLGHFAGTGEAICNKPDVQACADGKLQVGLSAEGTPNCVALATCSNNDKLSYDGNSFKCQTDDLAKSCQPGQVVTGVNSDGSPKCDDKNSGLSTTQLECPTGKYVSGLQTNGAVICRDIATVPSTTTNTTVINNPAPGPRCTGSGWINQACFSYPEKTTHRKVGGAWSGVAASPWWHCNYFINECARIGGVTSDIDTGTDEATFRACTNRSCADEYTRYKRFHSCACIP